MKAIHSIILLALAPVAAFAQTPPPHMEFEVASVRPSAPQGQERVAVGLHMDGSHVRISSFSVRDYTAMAYRLKLYQVTGPDWISTSRFDLNATLPAGATADNIPEMLQALLTDRFQLKFHREKKDFPVYALVPGKGPLKIKEDALDADDSKGAVNISGGGSAAGVSVDLGKGAYYTFADNKMEAKKVSMDRMSGILERFMDRPILNTTDLKGTYDVILNVTQEDYQAMLIRAAVNTGIVLPPQALRLLDNNSAASLMEAVEQTGLKLDPRKAPLDFLVVDQALKTPTEN